MLMLFWGPERYPLYQKIHALKSELKLDALSCEDYDAAGISTGQLQTMVLAQTFFGGNKMVIIRDLLAKKKYDKEQKQWLELFARVPATTTLILWEEKLDDRLTVVKEVKKLATKVEGLELNVNDATVWVRDQVKQAGGTIASDVAGLLVSRNGTSQFALHQELEKLLAGSNGKPISRELVLNLSSLNPEEDVFGVVDAFADKQPALALKLMQQNIASGVYPLILLKQIATQFERILYVKSSPNPYNTDLQTVYRAHPFVIKKTIEQSKRYSLTEVQAIYATLARMDLDIKNGHITVDMALDLLAMNAYPSRIAPN